MPDLTVLNNLSPLFQLAGGLGFGLMAAWLFFKAKSDQKKAAAIPDPADDLRVRWEGPVTKHLDFLEQIADGFNSRREIYARIEEVRHYLDDRINRIEDRLRKTEVDVARLPPRA